MFYSIAGSKIGAAIRINSNNNNISQSSAAVSAVINNDAFSRPELVDLQLRCNLCKQLSRNFCSVCKTPYCSSVCQRKDWETHRQKCKVIIM